MIDLKALRESAEKATPGPWKVVKGKSFGVQSENKNIASCFRSQNEEFITLANPQTIIKLCDMIEKMRNCDNCKHGTETGLCELDHQDEVCEWVPK